MLTCARLMLVALGLAGCAPLADAAPIDAAPLDAGPPTDGGPPICDEVDRACPESVPQPGSACEGDLECRDPFTFPSCDDPIVRCIDGRWVHPPCITPGPLLAEGCSDAALGPFSGLALTVDPPTELVWGLQGNAMIEFEIAIDPREDAPGCVSVRTLLTFDGDAVQSTRPVRLRCGRSLTIQVIVPGLPCDDRAYEGTLEVEVIGLATQTIDFSVPGGQPAGSGRPVCDTTG